MANDDDLVLEGFAAMSGIPDMQGDLILPEALQAAAEKWKNQPMSVVDLRFNQREPVGRVKSAEFKDGGIFVTIGLAPGVMLRGDIDFSKYAIRPAFKSKRSRREGDVTIHEEIEFQEFSIMPPDEAVPLPQAIESADHNPNAVTKEEFLWAVKCHLRECVICSQVEAGICGANRCDKGKLLLSEAERQGWRIEDAPNEQPRRKR